MEGHSTTLTGDVSVHQGSQLLRGDFFTMDVQSEQYTVEGNVRLRQKGLLIQGARVEGNFYTGTAAIDSASFLLHDNRLRGTATSLKKNEQDTLTITEGDFTTCELPDTPLCESRAFLSPTPPTFDSQLMTPVNPVFYGHPLVTTAAEAQKSPYRTISTSAQTWMLPISSGVFGNAG
jgi:hypothetical protein